MDKRSLFAAAILSAGVDGRLWQFDSGYQPARRSGRGPKGAGSANSPFAKVKEGMGYDEVVATIGPPPAEPYPYQTGKAWIPFHYGGDNFRKRAHYKGIGSITFSSNSSFSGSMSVMSIDYDPTDKGFEPGTDGPRENSN